MCHVCLRAKDNRITESTWSDLTFTTTGANDWKKALNKFKKCDQSESHQSAVQRQLTLPSPLYVNAAAMLSNATASEQNSNRAKRLKILENVRFLGNKLKCPPLPCQKDIYHKRHFYHLYNSGKHETGDGKRSVYEYSRYIICYHFQHGKDCPSAEIGIPVHVLRRIRTSTNCLSYVYRTISNSLSGWRRSI